MSKKYVAVITHHRHKSSDVNSLRTWIVNVKLGLNQCSEKDVILLLVTSLLIGYKRDVGTSVCRVTRWQQRVTFKLTAKEINAISLYSLEGQRL
jgi:hypothetical protein